MQRSPTELRSLRLQLGWTQAEMMRRLGCKRKVLEAYESGERAPDKETMIQYEGLFSILQEQARRQRVRPIADHLLQAERLQQVDQDSLPE